MSIRYKLLIAFSIVLALAGAVAYYGIRVVSNASGLVVRLYDEPFMAVSHARAAQARFNEARAAMERGLSLRESAAERYLAVIKSAMKETIEELDVVRERTAQANAGPVVGKAQELARDWYATAVKFFEPGQGGVTALPLSTTISAKADAVADAIDQVVEAASAFGFQFRSEAEAKVSDSRFNLILLACVTGAMGLALSLGVAYSFGRPIRHAMAIAERVAAGNLTEEIATRRRDELGRLLISLGVMQEALRSQIEAGLRNAEAKEREQALENERRQAAEAERRKSSEEQALVVKSLAQGLAMLAGGGLTFPLGQGFGGADVQIREDFNTRIGRLRETIEVIAASAREVSTAASEIAGSTTELAQSTEAQSENVERTTASMEQICATVKKNAENARQANHLAAQTRDVAARDGTVIADAIGAMSRIEESSHKISDIVGVIDEIARQTNLLALNAAVEAARAGEAGRGFAVVAAEVRSLAQRSSKAAKDITDLITSSSDQVAQGVELANRAGSSLHEILASIKSVADIVSDIANASAEQAIGLEQINNALNQIDEGTQQNSALVEQNAATAKTLEHQSVSMTERIGFFRLDDDAGSQPQSRSAGGAQSEGLVARQKRAVGA